MQNKLQLSTVYLSVINVSTFVSHCHGCHTAEVAPAAVWPWPAAALDKWTDTYLHEQWKSKCERTGIMLQR